VKFWQDEAGWCPTMSPQALTNGMCTSQQPQRRWGVAGSQVGKPTGRQKGWLAQLAGKEGCRLAVILNLSKSVG
jgi:hypothetical protein